MSRPIRAARPPVSCGVTGRALSSMVLTSLS